MVGYLLPLNVLAILNFMDASIKLIFIFAENEAQIVFCDCKAWI